MTLVRYRNVNDNDPDHIKERQGVWVVTELRSSQIKDGGCTKNKGMSEYLLISPRLSLSPQIHETSQLPFDPCGEIFSLKFTIAGQNKAGIPAGHVMKQIQQLLAAQIFDFHLISLPMLYVASVVKIHGLD